MRAAGLGSDVDHIGFADRSDGQGRWPDLLCDLVHERRGLQDFHLGVDGLLLAELEQ